MIKNIRQTMLFIVSLVLFLSFPRVVYAMSLNEVTRATLQGALQSPSLPSPQFYPQPNIYIQPGGLNGGNHSNSTDFGIFAPFASFFAGHPLLMASASFGLALWGSPRFRGMVDGWLLSVVSETFYKKAKNWWRKLWGTDKESLARKEGAVEQSVLNLNSKINNLQLKIDSMRQKMIHNKDKYKQNLEKSTGEIERLKKKNSELKKKQIESSLNRLNATQQFETVENYNKRLEDEKKELERKLEDEKQKNAKAIQELAHLQGLYKGLETQLGDYKNREQKFTEVSPNTPLIQDAGVFSSPFYSNQTQSGSVPLFGLPKSNVNGSSHFDFFSINKKNQFFPQGELPNQDSFFGEPFPASGFGSNPTLALPAFGNPRQPGSDN